MVDENRTLKLVAIDERRRARAEVRQKAREERRVKSVQRIRARAAAYKERRDRTLIEGKRRRGIVGVYWTSKGISKLQADSTRDVIMRYMKANLEEGAPIKVEKLARAVADHLYGDSIRPHLRKLEEAAHIEYVFKL